MCVSTQREREREIEPPFSTGELPLHELGELSGCDVGVRVSPAEDLRELVAVKAIQGNQIGFVEGFYAR